MIFLIEYDRLAGRLCRLDVFTDDRRLEASKAKLELEITLLGKKISREVVLLEAISEDDLRMSHNRYFRGIKDMAEAAKALTKFPDHKPDGKLD